MSSPLESDEDTPDIVPGEVVHTENGDLAYTVIKQIGTGRCCVVYSGSAVRDGSMVALKFFRRGSDYEGAVQRERYILDTFRESQHNMVFCYAYLTYRGMHCLVLELLDVNIRQIIFKNDRHGLSPWATCKFAKDLLTSLRSLHQAGLVHADLKPANVLWSGQDGVFKCIDFGLSFSLEEEDLHQIQSSGYRSPEATAWNNHKEDQKLRRKRKLEGTFLQLNYICPPLLNRELEIDDSQSVSIIRDDKGKESLFDHFKEGQAIQVCQTYANKSTKESDDNTHTTHNTESQAGKPEEKELHHSDSHSSGIFSQESSQRSQCSSRLSWDEDKLDKFNEKDIQDWRKSRGKSVINDRKPLPPCKPTAASDIWSFGCLITEALTGRKLFQRGDKLASVLRPSQLLEMKLGETEVVWTDRGQEQMFNQLKDLIVNCIKEDPSSRVTADEALNYPIFKLDLDPSKSDILILQSPILQFSRYQKKDSEGKHDISKEMLETLRAECEAYGEITECKIAPGGHAFVHFHEVGQAVFAKQCFLNVLTKENVNDFVENISYFNNQDQVGAFNDDDDEWVVTFYPVDLWNRIDE